MEIQEGQHLLQTAQFRAKQGLLEQNRQKFRRHLLFNSSEIPFVNPKWKRNEEGHFSEVKTQAQILLLSQTGQRYISTRLNRFIQTLGVQNATANSIRHASSTELAAQGFDGRTINVLTHHIPDSKMNQKFYIFAVNREQDSIAFSLVQNHGEKQATQIVSKQRGGSRVSEASPLSLPIISTKPIVEAESPNDHESAKVQNSQMQKDEQDAEPQDEVQDSSMTKDSDRATTAGAQK
ncbi:MAG: hypothetical protein EZS28_030522 [Streblomastix strix]|uniref:Tyr recombinase domain-containing protein n=1 Tax=Streblomastix strix TaxID=222440 RepID=A0A5J4UVT0_9EUKA|nr:MAG: hypothetical protein EZS28_030522 [Streblomastix strix]